MSGQAKSNAELFDRTGWWDAHCRAFASLRAVSAFRLALLREWLPPVRDLTLVDLGCGGGLLGVPLAGDGARVVGVDLACAALQEAAAHANHALQPICATLVELPLAAGCADVVLLADVLEHIAPNDLPQVFAAAARLLRRGGVLFVNTIARTWLSRVLAITVAEGLRFLPRGTHRHDWFVQPMELDAFAAKAGLTLVQRCGESPALWASLRQHQIVLRRSRDLRVGFAALYRKAAA